MKNLRIRALDNIILTSTAVLVWAEKQKAGKLAALAALADRKAANAAVAVEDHDMDAEDALAALRAQVIEQQKANRARRDDLCVARAEANQFCKNRLKEVSQHATAFAAKAKALGVDA